MIFSYSSQKEMNKSQNLLLEIAPILLDLYVSKLELVSKECLQLLTCILLRQEFNLDNLGVLKEQTSNK